MMNQFIYYLIYIILLFILSIYAIQDIDLSSRSPSSSSSSSLILIDERQLTHTLHPYILLTTLHGDLIAVDRIQGKEKWRTRFNKPAIINRGVYSDININDKDSNNNKDLINYGGFINANARELWIPEPVGDGTIYVASMDDYTNIRKKSLTMKDYAVKEPSFDNIFYDNNDNNEEDDTKDSQHSIIMGSKETTIYNIDVDTGEILQEYNETTLPLKRVKPSLLIGRTMYTVTLHSASQVSSKTNVSYLQWHPLGYQSSNIYKDKEAEAETNDRATADISPDELYFSVGHDGRVYCRKMGVEDRASWVRKFGDKILQIFDMYEYSSSSLSEMIILSEHPMDPHIKRLQDDIVGVGGGGPTLVALTEDGAPYAMSAENYPLINQVEGPQPIALIKGGYDDLRDLVGIHQPERRLIEPPQPSTFENESSVKPILRKYAFSSLYAGIGSLITLLLAGAGIFFVVPHPSKRVKLLVDSTSQIPPPPLIPVKPLPIPESLAEDDGTQVNNKALKEYALEDTIADDEGKVVHGDSGETPKRRKRGGRGKGFSKNKSQSRETKEGDNEVEEKEASTVTRTASTPAFQEDLKITDTILGKGSHGTIVYKGFYQDREVAVKRMLIGFYDFALQEINTLQATDDHPNIIRYYCRQSSDAFLFIALELCPASLLDIIERSYEFSELTASLNHQNAMRQIASGIQYLHAKKLVHRDIKPQNILVSAPKKSPEDDGLYTRMLISDFGLTRRIEGDNSSFQAMTVTAAGTTGWRAPELLLGDRPNGSSDVNHSASKEASIGQNGEPVRHRISRSTDIFSLGCLFYYILTGGEHPFGDRYSRDANIIKGQYNLEILEGMDCEGLEAKDLIGHMLAVNPRERPDATNVIRHPFFWRPQERLDFLRTASDRFDVDAKLAKTNNDKSELLKSLESSTADVIGLDLNWHRKVDKRLLAESRSFRSYHGQSLLDLLRLIRNKRSHYRELSADLQSLLGDADTDFVNYFTRSFPKLLITVYNILKEDGKTHNSELSKFYR